MAFQAPNAGQGRQNRKILEELEEQKKRLRMMQTQPSTANAASTAQSVGGAPTQPIVSTDSNHMTPQQRTALQHAHQNSVGYFITQDSSFGNLILPVLPRFENNKPTQ